MQNINIRRAPVAPRTRSKLWWLVFMAVAALATWVLASTAREDGLAAAAGATEDSAAVAPPAAVP